MRKFVITIMLAVFAACCYSQDAAPKSDQQDAPEIIAKKTFEGDLVARKNNLIAQTDDMDSIAKSLNGFDFDNAITIGNHAQQGMMYLDALSWFVGTYDKMQCVEDKNLAKAVLQNRLGFYAHLLDMAVDQTNGSLGLTRVPAVAQQGQRIRDELRAAKAELDEIAASLKESGPNSSATYYHCGVLKIKGAYQRFFAMDRCLPLADPVGTLITERPPDRPVRARLRIRFL